MTKNRIAELLDRMKEDQGVTTRDFAAMCGVNEQTLYKIRKKPTLDNVTIDVFLKIARALGMTAEELYYGRARKEPSDPREAELVRAWRTLDAGRQDRLIDNAHDMEIAKGGRGVPVRSETA